MSPGRLAGWLLLIALTGWVVWFQADRPATVATVRADDGEADAPIDWARARELLVRQRQGQALTEQERTYLERARLQRQQMTGRRPTTQPEPDRGRDAARESIGLTPLSQMTIADRYKGEDGGLYGGGRNAPPEAHAAAAGGQLARIVPLDAQGRPDADGKIVLMSIGMSNTTQEFSRFKQLADADPARRPEVVIVDAAQGGQAAAEWDEIANPVVAGRVWAQAERRLQAAGVTTAQVQAVWVKQALKMPARYGAFPDHARAQQRHTVGILHSAVKRLPNLRVAYLSSRIYGGHGPGPLNPEPFAYEGAFAVRWTILDQMAGKPELNWDPARGEVKAPLVLWGPYLWADGVTPRKPDGLTYARADLAGDGTHPSPAGRQKVAEQLLAFFKTDPLAKPWFARPQPESAASQVAPAGQADD